MTSVDISAMREDFCMKFYRTVTQSNIHLITKFGWNLLENDKLTLFQPRQPPHFSAFCVLYSMAVSWWLWKEPVCWWWDEDADLQTDRVIADAWVTIGSHSHVGSQALGKDHHRLVLVASLPKWSAKRLSTLQLSYASAGVYGTFPAWCLRCDSPMGSNLDSLRATKSSQWTHLHSVSSAWRFHTEKGGLSWLKQHNFVIFWYISTKLGGKVYIWLFEGHVKFHVNICTHWWNINKSHRGATFFVFTRYTQRSMTYPQRTPCDQWTFSHYITTVIGKCPWLKGSNIGLQTAAHLSFFWAVPMLHSFTCSTIQLVSRMMMMMMTTTTTTIILTFF